MSANQKITENIKRSRISKFMSSIIKVTLGAFHLALATLVNNLPLFNN